jgi:endoglucanase
METLKRLLNAFGPSGCEDDIADIIIKEIKDYADEVKRDRLGNVIAVKKGSSNLKMMVAAHMDQIGVMVTDIDKNGYLRFTDVGYVDPLTALFHNVVFKNGVTGTVAYETKKEIKDIKMSHLYIDIGASSREEAMKKVKIGDYAVFKTDFAVNEDRITSAAMDDRIGCHILIEALKRVKDPTANIYFVFTVQEESYISGASTSAYAINLTVQLLWMLQIREIHLTVTGWL